MIKNIVLAVAVAAVAVAFAPTASYAKKAQKSQKCVPGHMVTGQPNQFGWAPVSSCGLDGKMYRIPAMCYTASKLCPGG